MRGFSFFLPLFVGAALAADRPAASGAGAEGNSATPLTSVAEAFARWPQLTADDVPVRLEGVVTGTMPSGAFRMHDGQLGIYVTKTPAGQKLTPGDLVVVRGVLRKGGFSPWITPHVMTMVGRGALPEARPASYSLLASGAADHQWLEIVGVIRAAEILPSREFIAIDLGMSGGNLRVLVSYSAHPDLESLVDAEVRLRGIAAVNVNKHGHVVEPWFRVPSFAEIAVLRPPAGNAFTQPLVPVGQLMQSPPGSLHRHRMRTRGVVTRRLTDTMFFLRDERLGLKVVARQPVAFRPGEVVEVVGFPVMSDGLAVLEQAVARVVATEAPPVPVPAEWGALRDGTHNSDLVRVRARLVDWAVTGHNVTLVLQVGGEMFKGLLNPPPPSQLVLPEKNSWVNVTGICIISELEDIWFYQPRSFLLLVAGLDDFELVLAPPWWTPERLWRALAIAILVLLAAGGWVWTLRRQVERKRAVIEQQARHAAVLEERSRIARDLHDTLEQGLTGLSLQMKAMETDFAGAPHPAKSRLDFARQMLRQSRALARHAIRELRNETTPPHLEGLVAGLKRVADAWNRSGALKVVLKIAGAVRPLPPHLENDLLGVGTEAMTNAVKHGRADAIHVELDYRSTAVALCVKDNGTGFDPAEHLQYPAGRFGLLGMHERARELGGRLQIHSSRDHGTEIVMLVPCASESPPEALTAAEFAGIPSPNSPSAAQPAPDSPPAAGSRDERHRPPGAAPLASAS